MFQKWEICCSLSHSASIQIVEIVHFRTEANAARLALLQDLLVDYTRSASSGAPWNAAFISFPWIKPLRLNIQVFECDN
jgi:hypothetical protein